MGYISKNIAKIEEPLLYSASGALNFVTFSTLTKERVKEAHSIEVIAGKDKPVINFELVIRHASAGVFVFKGVLDDRDVNSENFKITDDVAVTAQNLANCILSSPWLASNFDVLIPFNWYRGKPTNGSKIMLVSKGTGSNFNISITAPNTYEGAVYRLEQSSTSTSNDSISGNAGSVNIDLSMYEDAKIFLGGEDAPTSMEAIGSHLTTLSKLYVSPSPIWFDVNKPVHDSFNVEAPEFVNWENANTGKNFRFMANVRAPESFSFYQSALLFCTFAHGGGDLTRHVYGLGGLEPLSPPRATPLYRGQPATFNFIYRDPDRGTDAQADYMIGIELHTFDDVGNFLGATTVTSTRSMYLHEVNTVTMDIDSFMHKDSGAVEARLYLSLEGVPVSEPRVYRATFKCADEIYYYLNPLGGWETISLKAIKKEETKVTREQYTVTATPFNRGEALDRSHISGKTTETTLEAKGTGSDTRKQYEDLASAYIMLDSSKRQVSLTDVEITTEGAVTTFKSKIYATHNN